MLSYNDYQQSVADPRTGDQLQRFYAYEHMLLLHWSPLVVTQGTEEMQHAPVVPLYILQKGQYLTSGTTGSCPCSMHVIWLLSLGRVVLTAYGCYI